MKKSDLSHVFLLPAAQGRTWAPLPRLALTFTLCLTAIGACAERLDPLEKALELSHAHNMYAYDAYLIQCAQQTSTPLLTLDNELKVEAENAGVHTLEVGL